MAIGTTAAIIGAGVIGAGASLIGSSRASRAAGQAADAQENAAREAAAVQREVYQQNVQLQQPWMNTGLAAMGQINALLGLGGPTANTAPTNPNLGTPTVGTPGNIPLPESSPYTLTPGFRRLFRQAGNGNLTGDALDEIMQNDRFPEGFRNQLQLIANRYAEQNGPVQTEPGPTTPTTPTANPQEAAEAAYDRFRQYTGYQSRLDEANRGFNSAYAARGTLQSGAALQDLARMNQDYASREFSNYMGYLGNQQQIGAGATNALSGVGTNYGNNMANIAMQNGNNQANAAIAQGNAWMGGMQGVGNAFGNAAGMLTMLNSSYSDRRLKRDIEKVGEYANGLGKYQWVYKHDPSNTVCEGVLADEVKALVPEAYSEDSRGFGMVDYAKLGIPMKVIA